MDADSYAESSLTPLKDYLVNDDINEVVVNPDGDVFVEWNAKATMTRIEERISVDRITELGTHLAAETNNRLSAKRPLVSGQIYAFGRSMRIQIVIPPAVEQGISLSIRKYLARGLPIDQIVFLKGRQTSVDDERTWRLRSLARMRDAGEISTLLEKAIADRLNILISGGTSSGKTTLARAILGLASMDERIVTIEDAAELHLPHPNQVAMIAERAPDDSQRSPARLLESALRMRPDRLILGEVRGQEALNLLEAINTGHPGSISTIHADSPLLALERLALMVMRTGVRLSRADVIDYARKTIDMIIQVGRCDGKRGILEIHLTAAETEPVAVSAGEIPA